ncbi:MAG: S8 family serine peptidase [Bacteroidetes bacterium]|nr:S8 family serine peptidase [Bacteroidota bacterium]MBU1717764.1 S8 family serine peptidase [Bacteroidota bacterium]
MKKMYKVLCVLLVSIIAFSTTLEAQTYDPDFTDGQIFIKLKDDILVKHENDKDIQSFNITSLDNFFQNYPVTNIARPFNWGERVKIPTLYRVTISDFAAVDGLVKGLASIPEVEYAEKVAIPRVSVVPNDTYYSTSAWYSWHLNLVNAQGAWGISYGSSSIRIAICDNAVVTTHEDLNVVAQRDEADSDNDANPPTNSYDWSHGTHCAGLAAAETNNGIGIASLGGNSSIVAVKCTGDGDDPLTVGYSYYGVYWAGNTGNADVISMSFGSTGSSSTWQTLMTNLHNAGIVLVAAAGNDNVGTQNYPAACTDVIAVGSVDEDDSRSSFSNYGAWVTLAAPGGIDNLNGIGLYSTTACPTSDDTYIVGGLEQYGYTGNYNIMEGTSMATPMVAGLAGLMLGLNPSLTPDEVLSCMLSSAATITTDQPIGGKRINAQAAMVCVQSTLATAPVAEFYSPDAINILASLNPPTVSPEVHVKPGTGVAFTDLSTANTTGWAWTFPNGTPASSPSQNPSGVIWSALGDTNSISMTASNAYGSDAYSITDYVITLDTSSIACEYLSNVDGSGTIYYAGTADKGYLAGTNTYGDLEKAEFFNGHGGYDSLYGAYYWFGIAEKVTAANITFNVYQSVVDTPGTLLGTATVPFDTIVSNVTNGELTLVVFDPPIALNGAFFLSYVIPSGATGDTISMVTDRIDSSVVNTAWERWDDNTWHDFAGAWGVDMSLGAFPLICFNPAPNNDPPVADFSASAVSICAGESITFTDLSTNSPNQWAWSFAGSTPLSSTDQNPTILFPTAGTYTVTLTATNAAGSDDEIKNAYITVKDVPMVTVAGDAGFCPATSASITASGATTYTWSPASGLSATTGSAVSATPSVVTTYTVVGTTNGCTASATHAVTPYTNPVVVVSGLNTICSGVSTNLTVTGASTYIWSPATGLSITTGSAVVASPTANITYTVTGENADGCTANGTIAITVNPMPSVTTSGNDAICTGGSATITAGGADTYTWAPGTGLSATTGSSVVASPTFTTTYTVTGTQTGCSATATATITYNTNPTISVSGNTTICEGASTALTAGGASTYTWAPATGLSATTGSTVTANPTANTTYTITGTTAAGCSNTKTIAITVNPTPVLVASNDVAICTGGSTTLMAAGANSYVWSPASGLSATTGSSVSANPAATTTYTVTGSSTLGCTTAEPIVVTVNQKPTVLVATIDANCGTSDGSATALAGGGTGSYTYSWNNGGTHDTILNIPSGVYTVTVNDGNCSTIASGTVGNIGAPTVSVTADVDTALCNGETITFTASGASTYSWAPATGLSSTTGSAVTATPAETTSYTVTGVETGCNGYAYISVYVAPLPIVNLGNDVSVCANASANITASGSYPSYTWNIAGLTGASVSIDTSDAGLGTTEVIVTATDTCGLTANDTINVTFQDLPVVDLGNDTTICPNASLLLNAGAGFSNYAWSVGGLVGQNVYVDTTNLGMGASTVTVTVTDACGITASDDILVTFSNSPTVYLGPDSTICPNESVTLDAGSGFSNYAWSEVGLSGATPTVDVGVTGTGVHTIGVTITDGCGNNASDEVVITIEEYPTVDLGSDVAICEDGTTNLDAGAGFASYLWSDVSYSGATPTVDGSALGVGTHVIYVTVTDDCGSEAIDSVTVTVNPLPVAGFSYVATQLSVDFTNASTDATTYVWTFGDGNSGSTADPTHVYAADGTYTVTLVAINGCGSDTTQQSVTVVGVGIASASNQGIVRVYPNPTNGMLFIDLGETTANAEVRIVNQLGEIVMESRHAEMTNQFNFDVSHLPAGIYNVQVMMNKTISTHRIAIQK